MLGFYFWLKFTTSTASLTLVFIHQTGYKRPLQADDIPYIDPDRSVEKCLADVLKSRFISNQERGDKFPLWWALYDTFKREFWIAGVCRGLADILLVTTPYTLRFLIQHVMDSYQAGLEGLPVPPLAHGIGLLVGVAAMLLIQTLAHNQFMFLMGVIGGQSRSMLVSAIFGKSMHTRGRGSSAPGTGTQGVKEAPGSAVSAESNQKDSSTADDPTTHKRLDAKEHSIGHLTNFMSVDCNRIDRATTAIHMLWTAPMSLIIAVALLIVNLGTSALAGLGLLIVGFALLITAVGVLFGQRKAIDKVTRSRMSLIHEVLGAVRLVKYLAWEDGFVQRIAEIRAQETQRLHGFQAVRNIVAAISQSLPVMTAMVSFITYAKTTQGGLSPAIVFSSVALFTSLRMPLIYLPLCIQGSIDSWAALRRVQDYLLTEEPEAYVYEPELEAAAEIRDATFVWNHAPEASERRDNGGLNKDDISVRLPVSDDDDDGKANFDFKLENINLSLRRGELVAIIGSVGAGKTSLLSAFMGEMTRTSGAVVWGGRYAICPQQAWVYNATIRDNIIFGLPIQEDRYQDVIRASSLARDLDMLAHGDSTVVGERGVVLSGGQKQRISLARAIYSHAEVLLLDDPLSAVDANVGKDILDKGICGALAADRTRVLCTHDIRLLSRCHRVLWMEQGRIRAVDSYEKLMATKPEFARFIQTKEDASKRKNEQDSDDEDQEDLIVARPDATTPQRSERPQDPSWKQTGSDKPPQESDNTLMQEEDRAVRSVPWSVYVSLVKWSDSTFLITLCIPMLMLAQGSTVLTSLWLAWWSSLSFADLTTNQYIAIYAALAVVQALFSYLFGFVLAVCCTRSSELMLRKAIYRVLHAPMSFFDTTPLGRHTNRFSTDVEVTDYSLTEALRMFLTSLSGLAAIFAVIIVYFHWFAIAAGALLAFLAFLAYYYRATAREVKRLESIFRSVVFVRFVEGLTGASTLRAYGLDTHFECRVRSALDDANAAVFTMYAIQRWLGLRQDIAATLLVVVMGILVLVQRYSQNPAISGLVLSLMLNAVQVTQVVVREWADVENTMNAVERLYAYAITLPQEGTEDNETSLSKGPAVTGAAPNAQNWLRGGEVKFDNVRLRYRPGLPESLKGVNIHVRAGDHVAIVGRTGAGKSSIVNALFRMTELSGGSITIDGTDIARLRLQDVRGALSIIPQEANLFSGTVRSNLDPFDALPDSRLWDALRTAAGLHQTLSLSDAVHHDGANLSLGQRQLLALARVLVRIGGGGDDDDNATNKESRVLVCDEATAALDTNTDARIQDVLRTAFRDHTVICIAHRLRTVLWYDRVYVMDGGQVAESGSPLELFTTQGGLFRDMCIRHGITEDQVVESAGLNGEKSPRGGDAE
ncbi:hypothetical protein DL765_002479 [Monosporascus sp. GIB2]|nr:hypothetical protein DL765_002479 [Monosporascus sp. GIB2]